MIQHLVAILALAALCALWYLVQWLAGVDEAAPDTASKPGCGGCARQTECGPEATEEPSACAEEERPGSDP